MAKVPDWVWEFAGSFAGGVFGDIVENLRQRANGTLASPSCQAVHLHLTNAQLLAMRRLQKRANGELAIAREVALGCPNMDEKVNETSIFLVISDLQHVRHGKVDRAALKARCRAESEHLLHHDPANQQAAAARQFCAA